MIYKICNFCMFPLSKVPKMYFELLEWLPWGLLSAPILNGSGQFLLKVLIAGLVTISQKTS